MFLVTFLRFWDFPYKNVCLSWKMMILHLVVFLFKHLVGVKLTYWSLNTNRTEKPSGNVADSSQQIISTQYSNKNDSKNVARCRKSSGKRSIGSCKYHEKSTLSIIRGEWESVRNMKFKNSFIKNEMKFFFIISNFQKFRTILQVILIDSFMLW